jgi:hypothetical protein
LLPRTPTEVHVFRYAIIFLIISVIAGGIGLTNISLVAKRISFVLFGLFFLGFLAMFGFAYLLGAAFDAGQHSSLLWQPVIASLLWQPVIAQAAMAQVLAITEV